MGCSVRACQAVGELLRQTEELRALHLLNNMSDDEGAAAIGQVGTSFPCKCLKTQHQWQQLVLNPS